MDTVVLTLESLPSNFGESSLPFEPTLRCRRRAKAFSTASYVTNVLLSEKNGDSRTCVSAKCYHSQMKNKPAHVITLMVADGKIFNCHCSCKAGVKGECAHVVAVVMTLQDWLLDGLILPPAEVASTSRPQQWGKPRGIKIKSVPTSEMVLVKPHNTNRKRRPLTAHFVDNRSEKSRAVDFDTLAGLSLPISYLTSTPYMSTTIVFIGSAITYHEKFLKMPSVDHSHPTTCKHLSLPQVSTMNFENYDITLWPNLTVTLQEACDIEKNTTEQSKSALWFQERKDRITASQMSRILNRKARVTTTFLDSVFSNKSFQTAATTYGLTNESTAKQKYLELHPTHHLHDIGLVINPQFPFLAATPDARICTEMGTFISEIKCPYSARDLTIDEAINKLPTFCLQQDENGCHLKQTHDYWFQVQGQLMVTGAEKCIFILYTRKSLHVEDITPSATTLQSMFDKLYKFYVEHGPSKTCNTGTLEMTVFSDSD